MRIRSDCGMRAESERAVPSWFACALILGFYLSLRGYHSLDSDHTYRLPLLLHQQQPSLYADDPFVRALDAFNPHRGSLIVLDAVTRPLGLSAGLFLLFTLTFLLTCRSVERLTRAAWPHSGPNVGWIAVVLLLSAKAGNIGTNHLFEAMLLDRLMAFALGWQALALAVSNPEGRWWLPPIAIGLATWIHPSVGLQFAMVLASSWLCWSFFGRGMGVKAGTMIRSLLALIFAVMPGLAINLPRGTSMVGDLPGDVFWLLSVELQSPQHMLPHLWRMPQWLAWSCYLILASLPLLSRGTPPGPPFVREGKGTVLSSPPYEGGVLSIWLARIRNLSGRGPVMPAIACSPARQRLSVSLAIILAGLAVAWYAIEVMHQVRVTIFQPFRMATLARGIAIILIAGRLSALWKAGTSLGRIRAILLATGFLGDWLLVVVTSAELTISVMEAFESRLPGSRLMHGFKIGTYLAVLAYGFNFLARHDTESGNRPLLAALIAGLAIVLWSRRTRQAKALAGRVRFRFSWAMAAAWFIPGAAFLAAVISLHHPSLRNPVLLGLVDRCRFIAVPVDDIERLALWCRDNTPATARFIGPPGPKTFRLWSRRSVAFNRAASPYHAEGLTDWFARFQDHVDYHATPAEFVRAYLPNRHRFESRYEALSDAERAALAVRQGATYVLAAAPAQSVGACVPDASAPASPLELLHVEGRYAVYRVRSMELVHRHR